MSAPVVKNRPAAIRAEAMKSDPDKITAITASRAGK